MPSPACTTQRCNERGGFLRVQRWGWYSVAINIILATINAGLALASGSLAVRAEMIHNLVDLSTAIGVLVGMTFSTAYEIASEALLRLAGETSVDLWMLSGMVMATIIPLVFSHVKVEQAEAGEIVVSAGLEDIAIGETLADPEQMAALPTIRMSFGVNTSPFAGPKGRRAFATTS